MRLSDEERLGIVSACQAVLDISQWELRLYGSRVDDARRGGDIDLALVLSSPLVPTAAFALKLQLLAKIKSAIGERKLDLAILGPEQLVEPFWMIAFEHYAVLACS